MTRQQLTLLRLSNAAQDLSNAARVAHTLSALDHTRAVSGALSSREQVIDEEFQSIAHLLGYSVSRTEPATLMAGE